MNTNNNHNNRCHSISLDFPTLTKYSMSVAEGKTLEEELLAYQFSEGNLYVKAAPDDREDLVILGGIRDGQIMTKALQAGASDYMVKPGHSEQIFARLAVLDQMVAFEEGYQAPVSAPFDLMGDMFGSRDIYSLDHSLRAAAISQRIGLHMGFSSEDLKTLEIGCLLHDIGKSAIPDDILLKPGCFNDVDRDIVQMHPTIGAKFLEGRYPDDRITDIILHHHERLDGSGYPSGLKGDNIGLMVRIVSVADVYEALIVKRPYKTAMTSTQAIEILRNEVQEGLLDQSVVEVLEKVVANWDPLLS